jgi:tetratricopeptide (TPR) repeat protein
VAYTSEIDKLEARWRENPKGRNFAPLADAYRKAGLIDNAIILLENGLKLHPDYVSAHIVQARCMIDKKDDAAAQEVFRRVLTLDGENVIALRGLAELAERNGRFDEEVEWLTRLLNADPMNGDAAEALARAKGKASATPTAVMAKPEIVVEHSSPPATDLTTPKAGTLSPDVETFEAGVSFNPAAHAAAKAEGLEVQEDVELNSQQIEQVEIEGLARTQYEGSGMFKLDAPSPPGGDARGGPDLDEALPQVDLPLIMPDDVPKPQARVPTSPRAASDDDGAADAAALSQAEPVLTETMAELYLKQGHQQDALRVYRALLAQRPNDARLRSKVEQLSSAGKKHSGVSAQDFLKGIWSGKRAPAPPPQQSTLAAAFDVAGAAPQPPGEPSHPAQDHISLDSVFGEEAARRANAQAAPPPPAGAAGETAPAGGGFSFDEFFAAGKGAPPADEDSARTPGRSSGRSQRPVEDEAEADQFQQWLKKLKS